MNYRFLLLLAMFAMFLSCSKENIKDDLATTSEDNLQAAITLAESSSEIQGEITDPQAELKGRAVTRKIKLRSAGTMTVEYDSPECGNGQYNKVIIEAEGQASHLGRFTTYLTYCRDDAGNPITFPSGYLTAANGDIIYTHLTGGGVDPDLGPYQEYAFENGTGRFLTVTGSVTLYFTFGPNDTFSNQGTGTITY